MAGWLKKKSSYLENWLTSSFNRKILLICLVGLVLVGLGVVIYKSGGFGGASDKVEVLESATQGQEADSEIVVEIAGEVEKPGVYKLSNGARIDDLLIAAGGISANADRDWMDKYLNRAARLIDGQKVYIPSKNSLPDRQAGKTPNISLQGTSVAGLININTASQKQLESLVGIGPVYASNIIEHRPYSSVEELLSKRALKKAIYEKIKDKVTIY